MTFMTFHRLACDLIHICFHHATWNVTHEIHHGAQIDHKFFHYCCSRAAVCFWVSCYLPWLQSPIFAGVWISRVFEDQGDVQWSPTSLASQSSTLWVFASCPFSLILTSTGTALWTQYTGRLGWQITVASSSWCLIATWKDSPFSTVAVHTDFTYTLLCSAPASWLWLLSTWDLFTWLSTTGSY